jgi:hypothetical protein
MVGGQVLLTQLTGATGPVAQESKVDVNVVVNGSSIKA